MYVIDTQVHLSCEIGIEASLFAMDAVGIDAVLIDEWSGYDSNGIQRPYRFLPNGAVRSDYPMAREAVKLFPGRFAYTAHVDPKDPELKDVIQDVRNNPHQLCIRMAPKAALGQLQALETGGYDVMFRAAEAAGLPVMIAIPGNLHLLSAIAGKFEGLKIILDHCGILPVRKEAAINRNFVFHDTVEYANYSNVHVKLSFVPTISSEDFPFSDLAPHVRRLVDAFGEKRIMWASDHTQTKVHHTWSEALMYLPAMNILSEVEKQWIFAETAKAVLGWPVSENFGIRRRAGYDSVAVV